jgi:hypothetical protein
VLFGVDGGVRVLHKIPGELFVHGLFVRAWRVVCPWRSFSGDQTLHGVVCMAPCRRMKIAAGGSMSRTHSTIPCPWKKTQW